MARCVGALAATLILSVGCVGQLAGETGEEPGGSDRDGDPRPPGSSPGTGGPGASGGTSPVSPAGGPGTGTRPITPVAPGITAGPRPLRRLTRVEYENTVRALLRLDPTSEIASGLPDDESGPSGFDLGGPVGEVDFTRLQDVAERLATAATGAAALDKLVSCGGAQDAACARRFIESFGRRAFRRPLAPGEITDLVALYDKARKELQLGFGEAIAHLVTAMLQAPQFLYLWETPAPPGAPPGTVVRLGPHEVASRLSYFLLRSMPDDPLFEAVDTGRFATEQDVEREARRLLADPRSREMVVDFHRQWLHLAGGDGPLARAADAETTAFVNKVFAGDGKLETLLTSPTNIVNQTLAPIYGAMGVTGDTLREMVVNPQQRFGLLTQVHFLSTHADGKQSHPVKRGALLYQQLLCGELPAPPEEIPQPKPPRDGVSNRERFAEHGASACAKGCHALIDPLGFALESYDGTGRFRTQDGGRSVDASAALVFPGGATKAVNGAGELVRALVASEDTARCVATQWSRYALARREGPADAAAMKAAAEALAKSGQDVRELIVAITRTPSFLYRTVAAEEGVAP